MPRLGACTTPVTLPSGLQRLRQEQFAYGRSHADGTGRIQGLAVELLVSQWGRLRSLRHLWRFDAKPVGELIEVTFVLVVRDHHT